MNSDLENKKTEVLLNLINERYSASHEMRRRSTQFVIWLLGLVLISNGWLIVNDGQLSSYENVLICILFTLLAFITVLFIRGIQKGFDNNMRLIIKLEEVIGCYEIGMYKENEMLYPQEYQDHNGFNWSGHFETLYMWIGVTYLITILLILF